MDITQTENLNLIEKVQNRVTHTLDNHGLLIDLSIEHCKRYLQRKINSKTNVVVMYVDMNGSTKMSRDLPLGIIFDYSNIFSRS